ncbi:MAG: AsnC family protein [Rhodospirillales bacterium]|nr:AsnC family protein [Rhodospirillales bacterium]
MELNARDLALIEAIQGGLPLTTRPYAAVGTNIAMPEDEVIARLRAMIDGGVIRRFGVIVRHRELGYRANAMVVWDVPDNLVAELGQCMGEFPFVTLCYQRPRQLPDWPYNLFCMIHGSDKAVVLNQIEHVISACGLQDISHDVLFSRRRFKQRGAHYGKLTGDAA